MSPRCRVDGRADAVSADWRLALPPRDEPELLDQTVALAQLNRWAVRQPCACGCGELAKAGRNYRTGHKPKSLYGRIMAKVIVTGSGCWEWQGAKRPTGHGTINVGGKYTTPYRAMYELVRGPIADGLHIDHLCRNPPCCNPDHLEPVTPQINILRGVAPSARAHLAGRCARGHSLADAYRRKSNGEVVYCRTCRHEGGVAS